MQHDAICLLQQQSLPMPPATRISTASAMWHVLQFSDVLDLELASALAETVPVTLWEPDRSALPIRIRYRGSERTHPGSSLRIRSFPILRGYARPPLSHLARVGPSVAATLEAACTVPEDSPLICTIPYFADVASRWKGPVIYWLSDRIADYEGARREQVRRLDRQMVASATLVCPNSQRIAEYLIDEAGCEPDKILILPNATRAANLLPCPCDTPEPRPEDLRHLRGALAGVMGNLAGNMDWMLLQTLITLTPAFTWVFVGPADMPLADPAQQRARNAVLGHPRSFCTGYRPYGDLVQYARAFDVAVLPYRRAEPTYSGSSTRFYEHLAASRPMIALPGVAELLEKVPLVRIIGSAEEAARCMESLRLAGFDDGLREVRWKASQTETWQARASTLRHALNQRFAGTAVRAATPQQILHS